MAAVVSPASIAQPSAGAAESPQRSVPVEQPLLSVIVPVYNGMRMLPASLTALRASDLSTARWELIVVDDSSQDHSAEVASRYADRVIRLEHGPCGPAFARNRGAENARGAALVFVDADVCVHSDALRRLLDTFERDPEVAAVFGAYDGSPPAGGLLSQYRNLLHRYVHQRDAGEAVTFWAGCGAIRATAFNRCGGFNETEYVEASIEDIDLGYRLSGLGHRIVLHPEIQGRHLKRWTLWGMIVTDVTRRGIPWMRLLLSRKVRPTATLNLRLSEQLCTLLVGIGLLATAWWLVTGVTAALVVTSVAVIATLILNAQLLGWFRRQRGWAFAIGTIPLRLLYYTLNIVSILVALLSLPLNRQRALAVSQNRLDGNLPSER